MSIFGDELEAIEVGPHLGDMVDHWGNSEDGRMASVVLGVDVGCGGADDCNGGGRDFGRFFLFLGWLVVGMAIKDVNFLTI